jgi:hypothetical protein
MTYDQISLGLWRDIRFAIRMSAKNGPLGKVKSPLIPQVAFAEICRVRQISSNAVSWERASLL